MKSRSEENKMKTVKPNMTLDKYSSYPLKQSRLQKVSVVYTGKNKARST